MSFQSCEVQFEVLSTLLVTPIVFEPWLTLLLKELQYLEDTQLQLWQSSCNHAHEKSCSTYMYKTYCNTPWQYMWAGASWRADMVYVATTKQEPDILTKPPSLIKFQTIGTYIGKADHANESWYAY